MKLLLDTHILLWTAADSPRLSKSARDLISNPVNEPVFSVVSLWEIAIKGRLGRDDFRADPRLLRRSLIENGFQELPVTGDHAVAVDGLPDIHKDSFDRILIAQSMTEGMLLVTADTIVARYPAPIRLV